MDWLKVYSRMPVSVQNWLVGLYSMKLERDRGGKEYEEILSFLLSTAEWNSEKIKKYKEENIYRVLKLAYDHCPYYRKNMMQRE